MFVASPSTPAIWFMSVGLILSSRMCSSSLHNPHTFILLSCSVHPNMIYLFLSMCRHVFYPLLSTIPCPPHLLHPSDPSFPLLHLPPNTLFLSSIHLWSHFSSSWSTSDPPFSTLPYVVIPALPRAVRHVPVCELLVQEPACVVAPGQGWHRPAGMRGNRVWAFLYKRTIKPTAVHNELILIQVRCTSCLLSLFFLAFLFFYLIDNVLYIHLCLLPFSYSVNKLSTVKHEGNLNILSRFCSQDGPPSLSQLCECNLIINNNKRRLC